MPATAADENTALLQHNGAARNGGGSFVVHVTKDPSDFEPFSYCAADFSFALSLEELLPYRDDPWWQFARRLMFACFWLVLLLTFLGACALSYVERNHCNAVIFKASTAATTTAELFSPGVLVSTLQMTP